MKPETRFDILEIPVAHIAKGAKRKRIKDIASDIVVGQNNIDSYAKDGSREHRILHRAYNKYKRKYDADRLSSLSLEEAEHQTPESLQNTSFHEFGHHGRYKVVDPLYHITNGNPRGSADPTTQFYKWKLKHLLKPEVEVPAHLKDHYNYLMDINPYYNEGATGVLEIGYAGGLKHADGYPGEHRLREMLDDILFANPDYKYTIDLLDMRRPKRVWNALVGNYEDGGKLSDDEYL